MTTTRIALIAGIVLLAALVVVGVFAAHAGLVLVAFVAIVALVAAGNLLYGRHSHGAAAMNRVRAAQEAHDRAADRGRRGPPTRWPRQNDAASATAPSTPPTSDPAPTGEPLP